MVEVKRTLNQVTGGFAGAALVAVVVLAGIDLGEADRPDLADGAVLATAIAGAVGLVLALIWAVRSGERQTNGNRLLLGYISRLAMAEVGMLMGIVGRIMTGSTTALYVGFFLFTLALLSLASGLRRIGT